MTEQQIERGLNAMESIATSLSLMLRAIAASDMDPVAEDAKPHTAIRTMDDPPLEQDSNA